MYQIAAISNLTLAQIDLAIRNIDADFWAHASESELVEVNNRSENHQSPWFSILLSPRFLFSLAGAIFYLISQLHPMPWHNRPWNIPNAIGWAILWSLATAPLAGILHITFANLAEIAGFDRATWVSRQLQHLRLDSAARTRVKDYVDRYPECAAYQHQINSRGRNLRLVDLGVMVRLANQARVGRVV